MGLALLSEELGKYSYDEFAIVEAPAGKAVFVKDFRRW
jgi:hypothetical protein